MFAMPTPMLGGQVLPALVLAASPASVSKTGAAGSLTTSAVTVSISSGLGSIASIAWTKASGGTVTANSPSSASTTFTASPGAGVTISAVFTATVTSTLGQTATINVPVSFTAASAMSVGISPSDVHTTHATGSSYVETFTASVSGGDGNYHYSWGGVTTSGSDSAVVIFTSQSPGATSETLVTVNVTDDSGNSDGSAAFVHVDWTA
jgi:hypothetical protein